MSKTGRTKKTTAFPAWILLLLTVLVFVMCVHFLVEDQSFSTPQNLSSASYPNQSEVTHQDDIVQFSELPSQIPSNTVAPIIPALLTEKVQVFFPTFNPPNI
jgi:hypothetical protein